MHPLETRGINLDQKDKITQLEQALMVGYEQLEALPDSREKSIALTKMEECAMWGKKCISFN